MGTKGYKWMPHACEQEKEVWGQGGEGQVDMRGPEASCLGFYLGRCGAEGKGDLGLRHTPLAVSRLEEKCGGRKAREEGRAGVPGERPGQGQVGERFVRLSSP